MEKNLTTGSVSKTIVYFALPYLLSYFLQTLYGMADLFITGQFCGVDSITAVSNGSQVMHMLTVIIVGLAMGTTVVIGRAIGADNKENAGVAIGNTITLMIEDAYKKISEKPVQRYYILSTVAPSEDDRVAIDEMVCKIREEHGCQIIVNGVFPTIKYYLRLLDNTDLFVERYVKNLSDNTEINFEHKIAWNKVCGEN